MDYKQALHQQLAASLDMLHSAITNANDEVWETGDPPFWQHAYHIISSVNFYFSTFDPDIDQPNDEYKLPDKMHKHVTKGFFDNRPQEIVPKSDAISFLNSTRTRIRGYFDTDRPKLEEQFSESSGFHWLHFNKYELIIYNIRHIMQHTSILNQRLKGHGLKAAKWVAMRDL